MRPELGFCPDAVVFDLDGTLVDSVPDIAAALNAALAQVGHPSLSRGDIAGMMGHGSEALVARALVAVAGQAAGAEDVADVLSRYLVAYDAAPCVLSRLYPGAEGVLDELAGRKVKLALCTNKPEAITRSVLQQLGIARRFASVVGGRTDMPLKPAPDMLLLALSMLDVNPARAVMVGDSGADAAAAHAAGTHLVLLRHGYGRDNLDSLGAHAVLDGFADLPQALAGMTFPAA